MTEEASLGSEAEVVNTAAKVGLLLRGNWTLRSEVYYVAHKDRPDTEHFIKARNAVMRAFSESPVLRREEIRQNAPELARMSQLDLQSIIEQFAFKERDTSAEQPSAQIWRMKVPDDDMMQSDYPEIASKISHGGDLFPAAECAADSKQTVSTAHGRVGIAPKKVVSAQVQQLLVDMLDQAGRWMSLDEIHLKLEQQAQANTDLQEEVEELCTTKEGVEEALLMVTVLLHGVYVLKAVPPTLSRSKADSQDVYWDVLISAFSKSKVTKRTEINKVCQSMIGENEIPQTTYNKFIKRFAVNKGSNWTFRSTMSWK